MSRHRWRILVPALAVATLSGGLAGCAGPRTATIRVLSYNIRHGRGLDDRVDLERIARVIRESKADLVALQEVDRHVPRSGKFDQPKELAWLSGMHVAFGKNIDLNGGEYGNAVLSRFPIELQTNHLLPRVGDSEQRGLLEVRVRIDGRPLIFCSTHFDHRSEDRERLASAESLRSFVVRQRSVPLIVAGDFNAVPDSRVIRAIVSVLRDSSGASTDQRTFTIPANAPHRKIDYILYRDHPSLRCTEFRVVPEAAASDHRPVTALFTLGAG